MEGITTVVTDITLHTVDVDYDNDENVSVAEMKTALDTAHYYIAYVNLTGEQAKELIDTESGVVTVDVREESEYCDGHIPGALSSPWTSGVFQNEYTTKLPKQGTIVLVCRSGNRSASAGSYLYDYSFTRNNDVIVYNIKDGMNDWGYATETCSPQVDLPIQPPVTSSVIQPWLYFLLLHE